MKLTKLQRWDLNHDIYVAFAGDDESITDEDLLKVAQIVLSEERIKQILSRKEETTG